MLGRTFTGHRVDQSLVLYVSFISFCCRPPALYSRSSSSTLALLLFQTPHLLCPRRLRTHLRALDYDLVKFSLFRAPHPLAIVAARVCHRLAGLRIWFSYSFPSDYLALRLNLSLSALDYSIKASAWPTWPRQEASAPQFLPFLFTCALFRTTVGRQTMPPCCHGVTRPPRPRLL